MHIGTDLYLDTEFNGHGGDLISLALAATDGRHWYNVMPEPPVWHEWVREHVVPRLEKPPVDVDFFRASLHEYLRQREGATIYADWPGDFVHLMRMMSAYEKSWMVGCRMVLLTQSDPKPVRPHNALSDAIALMEWHRAR